MKQYYQILELPPNASPRRIKEQYRKLAKLYHPDRVADPVDRARFAEKFRDINQAYEALSEIVRRAGLGPKERKLDYLYEKGNSLLDGRQWAKATVVFNEIIAIDPAYRDTHARLRETRRKSRLLAALYAQANLFFRQENWTEAMDKFGELLRKDPHYKDAAKKFKKARRERLMEDFMSQSS
jgi:curved DNA-binding protein CbpA